MPKHQPPPQMTPEVGVVTLKSQPVSVISELTGRTTASLSAEVRPQVGRHHSKTPVHRGR